ncbi:Aldose epimerase [Flavobacterium sp. 9AF]|uniref:aldose 1-epimerase family protein n=1 Tax=Flavobacterium sp. 9AF TaxID=2653142 RepID=UPI0012F18617|nr:aldose 1-epimerase family protein [Flavobacterium sp. 9AF]VXB66422.1 Aldose epimerase [Flavobacterium sp. 9AF]
MIVTLKNKNISASISTFGAELVTLYKDDKNYIWEVDTQFWNKTSPVLFPIVGRLKNDTYVYGNKEYKLSRHGFARDNDFSIVHQKEDEVIFSFTHNEETLEKYPFQFELQIGYLVTATGIKVNYKVYNANTFDLPFSIGAHPAFALSHPIEEYDLHFNKDDTFKSHLLLNDLFSGKTKTIQSNNGIIPLNYNLFKEDALVFKNLHSSEVIVMHQGNPMLKISFEGFPYLGIWTKDNAPFLCIEPWYGHADDIETDGNILNKAGIQLLPPNSKFECSFFIKLY